MAKLGKHRISVENSIDYKERIGVDVEINVSKDGEFYFSLDDDQKQMLLDHGVNLSSTYNKRTHKTGTFYANSLAELKKNFKAILEEAVSGEILEDKHVILYQITTRCSYCVSEGVPVPNGTYIKDDEKIDGCYAQWQEGTERCEGANFGFSIFAQVYHKQVFKFKSGAIKTFYWFMNHEQSEKLGEYGKRLNDFSLKAFDIRDAYSNNSNYQMNGKLEIDYTEDNTKFFYNLLISICKLNEQIKDFIKEPKLLQQIINQQVKLLQ